MGLERFYNKKTEGIIVRSRARWHEHGEKSNKYFFKLRKKKPHEKADQEAVPLWGDYNKS